MSKGVLYAATAGLIGAVLWGLIAYYADMELGLLAWGIGVGVGLAMMAGAQEKAGMQSGVLALGIAGASILGGKYFMVEMVFSDFAADWDDEIARLKSDDQYAISWVADDVVLEYDEQGKALNYPPGANHEEPQSSADYPADVWREAEKRWLAMSLQEQDDFRASVIEFQKTTYAEFSSEMKTEGFLSTFSFYDVLWFGLGGFSAFKLGAGMTSEA